MKKPVRLKDIDLRPLLSLCEDYIDYVDSENYHEDNDYEYYIYESAISCIFGEGVWDYINSKCD